MRAAANVSQENSVKGKKRKKDMFKSDTSLDSPVYK